MFDFTPMNPNEWQVWDPTLQSLSPNLERLQTITGMPRKDKDPHQSLLASGHGTVPFDFDTNPGRVGQLCRDSKAALLNRNHQRDDFVRQPSTRPGNLV